MSWPKTKHIVHVGQTGQHDRTDPDYDDKRLAQLLANYHGCPKNWRDTFLAGLTNADYKWLCEQLEQK